MKNNTLPLYLLGVWILIFASCEPNFENETKEAAKPTSGELDLSVYVALGNSLTAGYADGALFKSGIENSYPNMLAKQFKAAGGGEFTQPTEGLDDIGGFSNPELVARFLPRLIFEGSLPARAAKGGSNTIDVSSRPPKAFNNMGVPGAKAGHLLAPGFGSQISTITNPYFVRMATNTGASVLSDALTLKPTFFTLWIGGNDVLGYATSGGDGDIITPAAEVGQYVAAIVNALAGAGTTKGLVGNVPNILFAPYFSHFKTTYGNNIPSNISSELANALNNGYSLFNSLLDLIADVYKVDVSDRKISFSEGTNNKVVIFDSSLDNLEVHLTDPNFLGAYRLAVPADASLSDAALQKKLGAALVPAGQARPATLEDYILLPALSSKIGKTDNMLEDGVIYGITYPLPNGYVIDQGEAEKINKAVMDFNEQIKTVVEQHNDIYLVDFYNFFNDIAKNGITIDGYPLTAELIKGGLFSLDGIHPTQRGYAVVANRFIEAINNHYDATIEMLDPLDYPVLTFPKTQ